MNIGLKVFLEKCSYLQALHVFNNNTNLVLAFQGLWELKKLHLECWLTPKNHQVITEYYQNKDRAGLASLPESSQWGDEIFGSQGDGFQNEDPGVNSDDEDDMFQVWILILYIVR